MGKNPSCWFLHRIPGDNMIKENKIKKTMENLFGEYYERLASVPIQTGNLEKSANFAM
jgi:hypothetical protein